MTPIQIARVRKKLLAIHDDNGAGEGHSCSEHVFEYVQGYIDHLQDDNWSSPDVLYDTLRGSMDVYIRAATAVIAGLPTKKDLK